MIDALDEAVEAGRNPLVETLARNAPRLPDWLGFVVTSRPEFDVKTPLQALNPSQLDTRSECNRADIRDYLRRELASPLQNRPDAARLVEQILEKSEGVFLYVERFCDDVQNGHLSMDRPEQFPQGLGGIFCQYFQRQFPDLEKFRKDVRPALRAILAARERLPVEILQRLFNWQDEELRDFTRTLGSLFPVTREAGYQDIKPYHKSLVDWLTDDVKAGAYFVSILEGHQFLAEMGWKEFERGTRLLTGYALDYLMVSIPDHFVAIKRPQDAKAFLGTRIEELGVKYAGVLRCSSQQEFLKCKLQVLLNDMSDQKRWHPKQAEEVANMGVQGDYCQVYRFPCCGLAVIADGPAPPQFRADGCKDLPLKP